jgi:hypothetical protein
MRPLYERTLPTAQLCKENQILSSNSFFSWHKKISLWSITLHGRWDCQRRKGQNLCLLSVELSWAGIMCFHCFFQHLLAFKLFYWSLLTNSITTSSTVSDETLIGFNSFNNSRSTPIQYRGELQRFLSAYTNKKFLQCLTNRLAQ